MKAQTEVNFDFTNYDLGEQYMQELPDGWATENNGLSLRLSSPTGDSPGAIYREPTGNATYLAMNYGSITLNSTGDYYITSVTFTMDDFGGLTLIPEYGAMDDNGAKTWTPAQGVPQQEITFEDFSGWIKSITVSVQNNGSVIRTSDLNIVGEQTVEFRLYWQEQNQIQVNLTGVASLLGITDDMMAGNLESILFTRGVMLKDGKLQLTDYLTNESTHENPPGWHLTPVYNPDLEEYTNEVASGGYVGGPIMQMGSYSYDASNYTLSCIANTLSVTEEEIKTCYAKVYLVWGNNAYVINYNSYVVENEPSDVDTSPILVEEDGKVTLQFNNMDYDVVQLKGGFHVVRFSPDKLDVSFQVIGNDGLLYDVPTPIVKTCPLGDGHVVLGSNDSRFGMTFNPLDSLRINQISFIAAHNQELEGLITLTSPEGSISNGIWMSDTGSNDLITFEFDRAIPDLQQIEIYYSIDNPDTTPTEDEMRALIQRSVSTTLGINDALLQFNAEESESLKQALMTYYPNGYPLDGISFDFGPVTMYFEGGTVVLRVSPTGGDLEVAPMGAYILRLNSVSGMTDVTFISNEVGEYTMQSAGCVPSIFVGSGNEGSFTDNQWSGWATDLQFTMSDNSPSFSAIHISYGATLIQAMEPTFNYDETTHMLELMTSTDGATIYYTLDGSDPNTGSLVYEGPIYLDGNVYLRAIAGGDGYETSGVMEFMNNDFTAMPVTFFYDSQSRTMSLMSEMDGGATIFYTRDGSSPLDTLTAERYIEPFLINSAGDFQHDIQAFARRSGYNDSEVTVFTREGHITADPTFTRADNEVTISCETPEATIYYATDGSGMPTQIYEGPVMFWENMPYGVQAQAVAPEMVPSYLMTYDVDWFKCGDVTFFVEDGQLRMESAPMSDGVQIYYTVDGTMPTDTSAVYLSPIPLTELPQAAVINAVAMRMNWFNSEVTTFMLSDYQTATPQVTIADQQANISCETPDASIAYVVVGGVSESVPSSYEEVMDMYYQLVALREDMMNSGGGSYPEIVGGTVTSATTVPLTYNGVLYVAAKSDALSASPVVSQPVTGIQAMAPAFDYAGLRLAMFTTTPGASIYYTTDGTTPSENSTLYTEPITLTVDASVQAIAANSQLYDASQVSTYNFVLTEHTTATPQFVLEDNVLFINSETPGAQIYYVIEETGGAAAGPGALPDSTSILYTGPIQLDGNVTVSAIAYAADYYPSAVNTYTASEFQCEAPTFAFENLRLMMTTNTPEATIYYTTDGTVPTTSANIYEEPIPLTADVTIRAIAVRQGWTASEVSVFEFVAAEYTVATPLVSRSGDYLTISSTTPDARFYYNTTGLQATENDIYYEGPFIPAANGTIQIVAMADGLLPSYTSYDVNWLTTSIVQFAYAYPFLTMSTVSPEATIHYTLDGSDPDTLSAVYTEPIEILQNAIVRAMAVRPGYNPSAITQYQVDIDANTVAAPVLAREGETVIITTSTPGATIYFTRDGSAPTPDSEVYDAPITPWENGLIRAMAVASGLANSAVSDFYVDWFNCEKVTFAYDYRSVVLTTATEDADIRYTLDGSLPSDSSAVYIEPLQLTANTTITAVAYREGYNPSEVTTYEFVLADHTCATPQFEREGNELTISTATEGAYLYWTVDGTTPSRDSYNNWINESSYTITLDGNMTVKAIAWREDLFDSSVATYVSSDFQVAGVTFIYEGLRLNMATATEGAAIYYTTDGTVPTTSSTLYEQPVELTSDCVVRAIAVREGWTTSAATTYNFSLATVTVAVPQFSRQGNELIITTTTADAIIYYTVDGSDPMNGNVLEYTNPIHLDGNVTVQAYAVREDMYPSAVRTYIASEFQVAAVTFNYSGLRLTMQTATEGATIYYTIDGSEPTVNSAYYSEPIELTADCVVRAIAVRDSWTDAEVTEYAFSLAAVTVAKPQFSRNGNQLYITSTTPGASIYYSMDEFQHEQLYTGVIQLDGNGFVLARATAEGYYDSGVSEYQVNWFKVADVDFTFNNLRLAMSTTTPDATIYYTTDGSEPTIQSNIYDNPIELTEDCLVQAIAVRTNWNDSEVTSYEFFRDNFTADSPLISREGNLVTITNITEGTTVYYTTDGSTPTTASNEYTGPIQVTQNCMIRAIATGQNFNPSPVVSYTVDWFQAERVEFAYNELYLEMFTSTADATIYYTTDGSYPSETSNVFTEAIMLTEDCDVRAIAVRQGWNTSDVTLYHFTRAAVTAPTPQFYRNGNQLSITTGNQDVQVFYTLDGTEPSMDAIEYTGPLTLTENVTVRAIALNEHRYFPSAVNAYVVDWFKVSSVEFALNEMRLTLSTPTADAKIYYTLDGTTPSAASVPYVAPLTLTADVDVRAIAVRQNWNDAPVSLYHFNLSNHTAPTPQFRRNGNILSISSGVTDVEIRYTLDGSAPNANSELYSAPIQLTQNGVVRAIAMGHSYANSAIALYEVDWFRVAGVEFALFGQELELHTSTDEAEIHYTIDGSQPTANSAIYSSPLLLTADADVRALAMRTGWTNSEVSLFQFRRASVTAATPNFSRSGNELVITTATADATIYYTTDGSVPTVNSAIYEGPIQLTQNCLVSAIAISDGTLQSGISTYVVNWFTVEDVTFTYAGGLLTMQTATPDARIYYTIDGSQPTEQSTRYTSPISIEQSCVVHAIAVREDMQPSNISSYYFSLENPGAVTPIFELRDNGLLAIFSPTQGATIYYTMDGTMPTEQSTKYVTPIQLTRNCTVRAIAVAAGYRTSGVAEFTTDMFRVQPIRPELFEGFLYLATETPNAIIHFTIDGTTPTAASPVFDVPIQLEGRTTVKAYGERDGYTSSDMLVTDIDPNEERCAQPEYILADQMLTISTITDGAKVYYSLDGSEPTIPYSGVITLEQNGTVRAVALKDQYKPSEELQLVIDRFYTDLPIFTRTEGTLALSCYTPNVTLHYTTDGSEPTETSPVYTAPIDLTAISQVRAMAVAPGYNASSVVDYNVALEMQNMVNIDYSGQIFTLTATDGATIYYTTDGTNPTTASQQYLTPTAVDGLCTIRAIAVKEGSNNANESIFEVPAFFDGETVTLRDAGALSQALGSNKAGLTELAVVGRINETDLATLRQETTALETLDLKNASTADHALPAGAFDNASFVSVSLPSDVQSTGNGLFTNCHNLAAVIWNAQTRIADEAFDGVQNPNLLLFVGAAGYAPASISNVIVGRQAQRITLTDGLTDGNFHSPRAFYAKLITYTHEYGMTTGIGKTQGWETLSVPFNVTRMSHATKGEILPFGAETAEDQQLPRFWLRELQSDGFAPATTIQAHMPYVVSMPNNPEYADRYCLNGSVTFEGQNVTVGITEPIAQNDGNGLSLISNFRHQEMAADILALNREKAEGFDEGSIFLPSNRDVQPFEAYVRTPGSQPVKLFEDIETGIEEVPAYMLRSNNRTTDGIYDLSGRQIGNSQLKKGIYIVNGKKVLK